MNCQPYPDVRIISHGCVIPLGIGRCATRERLRSVRDGIAAVRLFSVEACRSKTAGQVPATLRDTARAISAKSARWTRAAQMILVAMAEALDASPGFVPDCVILGTTSGGMTLGEEFYRDLDRCHPAWHSGRKVLSYYPQQPIQQALDVFGFRAPVRIISNACASGTNALGLAFHMIRSGAARRVLAGGYDALAELVFAGFDCLRASTPDKCRPFDAARSGLALGEGAALFCLQPDGGAIRLAGYGSTVDTHHLTQPHPSGCGPHSAMKRALATAGYTPDDIDYINAHGTGTEFNDASEARALLELCPDTPVSSTKGMTGHALGAAGAIEAAFCTEALQHNFLPANINFRHSEFPLAIVANTVRPAPLHRTLSNSFGFGGANASLLLEKCPA
ncbi:MAG: beta-ketoacyl-[acyl-carrier-protein] synthase family protein [Anaerorhabdus sp.]|uniref:beta-ketoacyl-[acyl-carrier-protein] synthase family protein n=1 Tax=Anaerorhabdus sp. TaxID=1872524 RepID=UPI003A8BF351